MVDYTVINGTGAELTNINAGGDDVPKYSIATGTTLTNAELAALAVLTDVAVMKDAVTYQQRRNVARILKYSQDRFTYL
jgi:hypothetical protein